MRQSCRIPGALIAVIGACLSGCGIKDGASVDLHPAATGVGQTPSFAPSASAVPDLSGKVILIDPGHNGGNSEAPAAINRKVPDGRGRMKSCNTTGTATTGGYSEHKFNWGVAQRLRSKLEASGVLVKLTRDSDTGVGPCVDVRGKMAEQLNVDGVVSIHADGAAPRGYGFHVIYSSPPLSPSQGEASISLASALRNALRTAGLPTSSYIGESGLSARSDLAGLNFSRRPAAMVECGNLRNAADAARLTSPEQQDKIADALAKGVIAWLSAA